ncbi:proteasome regulatory particle subunit, variant 2 [Entomophthora muscae]|uniref:Proteasome regulatory particle subunit, variant 2 n=1 Tax=Entomophthora muscae TaxID=34485 RepID=A0ACC2TWM7_9FUNG|nr:proteasome regulatory particle subunit, variant 2 [Entomophthora muscae]
MSSGKFEKMEKDFSSEVDALLAQIEQSIKAGQITEALEALLSMEKQTRSAADLASTTRILVHAVIVCYTAKDWKRLNETVVLLSKKHGQLKQAVTKMVQQAMEYLDCTPDQETMLALLDTLRTVTEGKIYLEVERAHLTRRLSKVKEDEGKISEAADILQELQVETFGSMEKREKTEFILEQMRLCLLNKDYIRTLIISRKINPSFFKIPENEDLKLRFYNLMVDHALHENEYLNICKYYREIYSTKAVESDETDRKTVLEKILIFIILAPYDHEQSDLLHRIMEDKHLSSCELYHQLAKTFTQHEIMRWPMIETHYGPQLVNTDIFKTGTQDGLKRWEALHSRVIEHNIRVIAKYYTRITISRLTELLDLSSESTEEFLSNLVVSKTVFARIDRPSGVVSFVPPRDSPTVLTEWTHDVNKLLGLIEQTTHLIAKEEMVHKIAQAM